jgi:hypothetical protein
MTNNAPAPNRPAVAPAEADATSPASAGCLVEIIELKWLMAGHGVRIHVEQLQQDAEYARRTLDHAASLPNPALRETASRVRSCMGLG